MENIKNKLIKDLRKCLSSIAPCIRFTEIPGVEDSFMFHASGSSDTRVTIKSIHRDCNLAFLDILIHNGNETREDKDVIALDKKYDVYESASYIYAKSRELKPLGVFSKRTA